MQSSTLKKLNENHFVDKFNLLNSQTTSEDISWSCSDSSDYEDVKPCDIKLKKLTNTVSRKRKRGNNKKKDLRNMSNLDISIVDTVPKRRKSVPNEKSPVLVTKLNSELERKSPILMKSQNYLPRFTNNTSINDAPASSHTYCDFTKEARSPVIRLKHVSPKVSPRAKKKLFDPDNDCKHKKENVSGLTSPIINNKGCLDKRKYINISKKVSCSDINHNIQLDNKRERNNYLHQNQINHISKNKWKGYSKHENEEICIQSIDSGSEDSVASGNKVCTHIVSKVKAYFDSYFSSQGSQHSISECETSTPNNSSKNSDEIEIVNPATPIRNFTPSLKRKQTNTSFESDIHTAECKKVKYKKGSLGYRLNELLKKQNANISLWQHERFMAANSNFVIPREKFLAFRIKHVDFKYNIYLVTVVDTDDKSCLVVINSIYVNNIFFKTDDVLKVFEPFTTVDSMSGYKILLNVCKFESGKLKL